MRKFIQKSYIALVFGFLYLPIAYLIFFSFNEGKSLNEKDIKLFISSDTNDNKIRYELLDKNNPLGVVLGNITNCCQVIGGQGASCVEYGITMPNSKFMVFSYNDIIIGQSWVWYDEENQTICLDNIEVPHRLYSVIKQERSLQESFVECLLRVSRNFKSSMEEKGLHVKHFTIGNGYNDINEILYNNFAIRKNSKMLSNYGGYSDAKVQYEVSEENKYNIN